MGTEAKPARKMLFKKLNNTLKACRVFNSFELKPILANSNITQRAAQQLNLRVNNLKHPYVRETDVIKQEYTNDLEKSVGKTLLRRRKKKTQYFERNTCMYSFHLNVFFVCLFFLICSLG